MANLLIERFVFSAFGRMLAISFGKEDGNQQIGVDWESISQGLRLRHIWRKLKGYIINHPQDVNIDAKIFMIIFGRGRSVCKGIGLKKRDEAIERDDNVQ